MNKLKVNLLALAAVVVAAGTVAFKPAAQEWVFTGNSPSQVKTASFYSLSAPNPVGCETEASLPCSILSDATNQSQLQNYLNARSTAQIMDEAIGQRD